jgi:hypothetical protein
VVRLARCPFCVCGMARVGFVGGFCLEYDVSRCDRRSSSVDLQRGVCSHLVLDSVWCMFSACEC